MKTAIIAIKSKSDEHFLKVFFKKAGIKARILRQQEIEDAVFAALIDEGMKSKNIPEESVMKVLNEK